MARVPQMLLEQVDPKPRMVQQPQPQRRLERVPEPPQATELMPAAFLPAPSQTSLSPVPVEPPFIVEPPLNIEQPVAVEPPMNKARSSLVLEDLLNDMLAEDQG